MDKIIRKLKIYLLIAKNACFSRTHNIIKTVQIIRPDNMMEDTQYNDENSSSHAFMLQAQLTKIKQDIVAAKAKRKAERMTHFSTNNTAVLDDDGDLYGPEAGKVSDELHRLTRERTQTYLNFTSLQAALKADQTNKAITRAFNLESDGDIALEKEEEQHVRELLEEQKELTVKVIKQHEEGVKQELELMKARLELAKLHSRYYLIIQYNGNGGAMYRFYILTPLYISGILRSLGRWWSLEDLWGLNAGSRRQ